MVRSGLVDKKNTKEVDKSPRVSPYRLATHAGFAYMLYVMTYWNALNCLRRPPESGVTLSNLATLNKVRSHFHKGSTLLPLVLLTGFFTAGISGGSACNTFPFVGPDWFISRKHLNNDIPLWKNFTENKLIVQVVHRTLATLMLLGISLHVFHLGRSSILKSSRATKFGALLLTGLLYGQATIGITSIYKSVPIDYASMHQAGAVLFTTALLYSMHTTRKIDPRHLRNLFNKLKIDNPQEFHRVMEQGKSTFKRDLDKIAKLEKKEGWKSL
jgi:cytochrome c oxidase assembly protein subunit 15